ncbi:hypothetical protein IGI04_037588 [Brassica rapa subsp. trilocularis]|uniref:Uncharacterized protein n=1 Tax=Brassica rapa subsp. trilocularis TaxID=1813537 RepID=A0ABQ7LHS9_BRACM|nr:hypothetical protein IGI04_037588 [Brassica rapa subsp. trilocularis]
MNGGNSRKESETKFSSSLESTNPPHRSSASDNLQRPLQIEEVMKMQLDRKTRSLTSSWRNVRGGTNEKEEGKD